jgi:hypothetical protein
MKRKVLNLNNLFPIVAAAMLVFASVANAQMPTLPNNPLTPTLSPLLGSPPTPVVQEPPLAVRASVIPVVAIARATRPATIQAARVNLVSSERMELGYLVTRLDEVDTAILEFQRAVGAESFSNLLSSLLAAVTGTAPALSSELEQSLPNIRALLNERAEINRRILGIVTPGASMKPGPYVAPTRSGPPDSHYQIYSSNQPATGAVVGPNPAPACHQEERSHREYRNVLLPNGFDAKGTPLYRNEYHPFPVSEMVDVCP